MSAERCPACGGLCRRSETLGELVRCTSCGAVFPAAGCSTATLLLTGTDGRPRPAAQVTLSTDFTARYRLERLLGAGSMGTVYLGRAVGTGKPLAIKLLSRVDDDVSLKRFLREGRLLSLIDHPRVVGVTEVGALEGHPYLVCEYLEGGSLRARMGGPGAVSPEQALSWVADVLEGLAACHERGIVHRDVKPENILLDGDGRGKIADLGIAKELACGSTALTAEGSLIGTPRYLSPEQARGQPVGAASDIYSAGVVLYELLSGRLPFEGTNLLEIIHKHASQEATPLKVSAPSVPDGVATMVDAALSKKPDARPASAAAFAAGLRENLRATVRPAVHGPGRSSPPRQRRVAPPPPGALRGCDSRGPAAPSGVPVERPLAPSARPAPPRSWWGSLAFALVGTACAVTIAIGLWRRGPETGAQARPVPDLRLTWDGARSGLLSWSGPGAAESSVRLTPVGRGAQPEVNVPVESPRHGENQARLHRLQPGRDYRLSVSAGAGAGAFSGEFTAPEEGSVRLFCPEGPRGPVRVEYQGKATDQADLVLTEYGTSRRLLPTAYRRDDSVWRFDRVAPLLSLGKGVFIEVRAPGGLMIRHPVEPVPALASGLCLSLSRFRIEPAVSSIVKDRLFRRPDYPRASEMGAFSSNPIYPFKSRCESLPRPVREGHFWNRIVKMLTEAHIFDELQALRNQAEEVLTPARLDEDRVWTLYEGLLKLQNLDLLLRNLFEARSLKLEELYRHLVRFEYALPPAVSSDRGLDDRPLFDGTLFFAPTLFNDAAWTTFMVYSAGDPQFFRFMAGGKEQPTRDDLKTTCPSERVSRAISWDVRRSGSTVELRTGVALLSPTFFFDVSFVPLEPAARPPFRLVLTHPGTENWHQAMAELNEAGQVVGYEQLGGSREKSILWGEIRATFPAALLPPGRFRVKIVSRTVPGASIMELSSVYRISLLRCVVLCGGGGPSTGSGR